MQTLKQQQIKDLLSTLGWVDQGHLYPTEDKYILYLERKTSENKMRRKIIALLLDWDAKRFQTSRRLDIQKLNAFLKEKGYLKKDLNRYKYKELPKLVSQMQEICYSQYKQLNKKLRK